MNTKNVSYMSNTNNSNVNSTTKQNIIIPPSELNNENSILWDLQPDEELRIEVAQKESIIIFVKNFCFKIKRLKWNFMLDY